MRQLMLLLLLVLPVCADDKDKEKLKAKAAEKVPVKDEVAILGTWHFVEIDVGQAKLTAKDFGEKAATIFVLGKENAFEMNTAGGKAAGTYKLDTDGKLKTIDMILGGATIEGLYQIDGDTLKICYRQEPGANRPLVFAPDAMNKIGIFVMKRTAPHEDKTGSKAKPAAEFFNGKDLTGWVNLNCGPKTWKVEKGELITSGTPYGLLRSDRQYENFEIEFEWMHINTKEVGNSGFFVWCDGLPQVGGPYTRGIEVQVLVNYPDVGWATNHGDVFSVSGAKCKPDRPHPKGYERCLPSENRCKGGGEWNHYKVIANDGAIKLHVNGKEVSGVSGCTPRKGYLAFESEGAECHYRNMKFKELPSTKPKKEEIANDDEGFRPIFNHTDLTGWEAINKGWNANGGNLNATGDTGAVYNVKSAKALELVFDWNGPDEFTLRQYEGEKLTPRPNVAKKAGSWQRERVTLKGGTTALELLPAKNLKVRNVYLRELPEEKK